MTYLSDDGRVNVDVSSYPFTGISGSDFTYSSPSNLGQGVTRPSSTEFTLAAGRSYVLIMSICMDRAASANWDYFDATYRVRDTSGNLLGNAGSMRYSRGSTSTPPPTYVQSRKNPYYRVEAVAFIPASSITTSLTVTLRLTSTQTDGTGGVNYVQDGSAPAGCVIMSVPS